MKVLNSILMYILPVVIYCITIFLKLHRVRIKLAFQYKYNAKKWIFINTQHLLGHHSVHDLHFHSKSLTDSDKLHSKQSRSFLEILGNTICNFKYTGALKTESHGFEIFSYEER